MKQLLVGAAMCAAWSSPMGAQLLTPNESGVAMGHVHMNVRDVEAHKTFWVALGATPVRIGTAEALKMDGLLVVLREQAPNGPMDGSIINHLGMFVPQFAGLRTHLEAAGIKILEPIREIDGLFKLAFVEDPWGTKIEVVEDTEWLGFHHLHLRSTDRDAALDWYENIFGGERDSLKGRIAGLRYGTVWLLISQHEGELAATEGRAFDHLGWQFPDLRAAAEEIKAKGVEFTMEPRPFTNPLGEDMIISFVVGPDGVRIEIVQPRA